MLCTLLSLCFAFAVAGPGAESAVVEPSPIPGYVILQTERYVIHAPDEAEATAAAGEVQYAINRFEHYFSELPPRITVLVAGDPAVLNSPEAKQIREQNRPFLPFLSRARMKHSLEETYILDVGAVLMQRDDRVEVAATLPASDAELDGFRKGDVLLELNREPVASLRDLKERYALLQPDEKVEFTIRRDDQEAVLSFFKPERAPAAQIRQIPAGGQAAAQDPLLRQGASKVLSHEVAHLLLIGFIDSRLEAAGADDRGRAQESPEAAKPSGMSYGHPALPDWFDEAVATLAEPPELQQQRESVLKQRLADLIPLRTLLLMDHPMLELAKAISESDRPAGERTAVRGMRLEDATGATRQAGMFYAQANSVARFIAERGDPGALRTMALNLADGRRMEDILPELSGLPPTVDELERQWLQWLERRPD